MSKKNLSDIKQKISFSLQHLRQYIQTELTIISSAPQNSMSIATLRDDGSSSTTLKERIVYDNIPYYMKFWRHVNLAILKSPYLATL